MKLILSFLLAAALTSRAGLAPGYVDQILQTSPRVDVPEYPRALDHQLIRYAPPGEAGNPGVKMTIEAPSPLTPAPAKIPLDDLSFHPLP